jgi:F0F1-type ATP synthase assembly protein I
MKVAIAALVGAVVGFVLGYIGSCNAGTCPLMANPLVTAVLGALAGAFLMLSKRL